MKKWEKPKCMNINFSITEEVCTINYSTWQCNATPCHSGVGSYPLGDRCPIEGCNGIIVARCEHLS